MDFDIRTHELVSQVVQSDGTVVNEIRPRATPLELPDHHVILDAAWDGVRRKRDQLLTQTDWVVTKAMETGQPVPQEWRDYRQALREITAQPNPFFVEWPVKPSASEPMPPSTVQTPDEEII